MSDLNYLMDRNDLADFLEIRRSTLTYILYVKRIENSYHTFTIPKKNGDPRVINTPDEMLKQIQRKLAEALLKHLSETRNQLHITNNISHAFEREKSILTNAKIHRNKRFILNVDLSNFFDCFHFGRVKGFFEKSQDFELPSEVATVIAQLACYQGRLPQGAPTSPIITNLICQILDMRLLKIAKKYKLDYTRYADDLTFSTNNRNFLDIHQDFMSKLSREIEHAGFLINKDKTRLQYKDSQQKVTGLVVNKKINVDKQFAKKTQAMAFSLYTKGTFTIEGQTGTVNQLEGRFSFIDQVDHYNNKNDINPQKHKWSNLNHREKQYQKFLFYKYFIANNKPLIITEGITDIIYLKAALMHFNEQYPLLITKSRTGFSLKISFLRRTRRKNKQNKPNRLSYIFGLSETGADAMGQIYKLYDPKGAFHYYSYFNRFSASVPMNPVILLFDNETRSKSKPLKKFLDNTKVELTENTIYTNIEGNLFLLTVPLVEQKEECEFEDLFDSETLAHKINGRRFSRNCTANDSCYGKVEFAKYILNNYQDINFDNFKPLLDTLAQIFTQYKE